MVLSQTEENYLKEIYHLSEDKPIVSTNALASEMNTTPASVNDMFKRLSQKSMIKHVKYKGSTITEKGRKVAIQIIRKHRLWEVFLVEKLKFQWDEVHEIAEQLEHIQSPVLVERLDNFLGNPILDPHGDPIPDKDGNLYYPEQILVSKMDVGQSGILTSVTSDDTILLQHIDLLGLYLGISFSIKSISNFDSSIVAVSGGRDIFISREVSNHLMITLK